jgi:cobalt/nickel transport system permease protein
MDVLAIDRWSTHGTSGLHRASAGVKVAAVLALVATLVVTTNPSALGLIYVGLLVALVVTRLPALPLLGLSVAPVVLSGVFALTRLGTTWESAIVIVEKGAISSLSLLLLVSSTPAPALFRVIRRSMPVLLGDILYLAYRSVFVLLERVLAARDALRLRGGRASAVERVRRTTVIGSLAVLRATELAGDQYAAMRLRGYPGERWSLETRVDGRADLLLLAATGMIVFAALSLSPGEPGRYLAFLPLLFGLLVRGRSRDE